MCAKSLTSIRRISLSYSLFNKVQSKSESSSYKSYKVVHDHYQVLCNLNGGILLPALTFINKNCRIIIRRLSAQLTSGSFRMLNYLPYFVSGNIVSGFGRGSKELGIPTANYPLEVVKSLPACFKTGVYYGWANIDNGPVYKMVMSIGWNPFYDNKEKSMETHILHDFNRDLYGCLLKICIIGYLRPEKNFNSLEELVACIKDDIKQAEEALESNETHKEFRNHEFFNKSSDSNTNNKTHTSE